MASILLGKIYKIYDDFVSGLELACKKFCSDCCTRNVYMTALEGDRIFHNLILNEKERLLNKVEKESEKKRFIPKTTTNRMAALCVEGKELPEEEHDHLWEACPLLEDDLCSVYEDRPFGCRCFISMTNCGKEGFAKIDPFIITVNNLFLQFIEHIDSNGYSGNLTDMILYLAAKNNNPVRQEDLITLSDYLVKNKPISVFLIPLEHMKKIDPILRSLQKVCDIKLNQSGSYV